MNKVLNTTLAISVAIFFTACGGESESNEAQNLTSDIIENVDTNTSDIIDITLPDNEETTQDNNSTAENNNTVIVVGPEPDPIIVPEPPEPEVEPEPEYVNIYQSEFDQHSSSDINNIIRENLENISKQIKVIETLHNRYAEIEPQDEWNSEYAQTTFQIKEYTQLLEAKYSINGEIKNKSVDYITPDYGVSGTYNTIDITHNIREDRTSENNLNTFRYFKYIELEKLYSLIYQTKESIDSTNSDILFVLNKLEEYTFLEFQEVNSYTNNDFFKVLLDNYGWNHYTNTPKLLFITEEQYTNLFSVQPYTTIIPEETPVVEDSITSILNNVESPWKEELLSYEDHTVSQYGDEDDVFRFLVGQQSIMSKVKAIYTLIDIYEKESGTKYTDAVHETSETLHEVAKLWQLTSAKYGFGVELFWDDRYEYDKWTNGYYDPLYSAGEIDILMYINFNAIDQVKLLSNSKIAMIDDLVTELDKIIAGEIIYNYDDIYNYADTKYMVFASRPDIQFAAQITKDKLLEIRAIYVEEHNKVYPQQ